MNGVVEQIFSEAGLVAMLLAIAVIWQTRQILVKEKRLKEWWEASNKLSDRMATALEENTKALTVMKERIK